MHRFFRDLRPTLHIAHRGGAALAPENTRVAFQQAVERHRTDMLELDVHLTRDGTIVVSHDATVERCTEGSGAIADLTYDELSRLDAGHRFSPDGQRFPFRGQGVRIPRLDEILQAFPRLPINLDLKTAAPCAPEVLGDLLRHEKAVERILCGSEQDDVAAELVRSIPDAAHYYPREALTRWVLALRSDDPVPRDPRFCALDVPYAVAGVPLVDGALLGEAARQGLWLNVWTVDDAPTMRALVAQGVGGVMTDRPDLLRSVLDERGGARL